ncbi:hypothetical protein ALNOE001_16810 [Candidatus Methanobinarius endosymbioticus]|uniref:Uncharacterized protein n=1 Tax=Candidatus Methanobinarius endosymbioticus TaxID=2006182 RepID=A0A366MAJ4_9EURY|nr:hypothetical protein ALNOE001_16810 [Candidatus Methanobinarius endosymbioticus]
MNGNESAGIWFSGDGFLINTSIYNNNISIKNNSISSLHPEYQIGIYLFSIKNSIENTTIYGNNIVAKNGIMQLAIIIVKISMYLIIVFY